MAERSSYLQLLPQVLWSGEGRGEVLGRLLLAFEKVLTGLPDDQVIGSGDRHYRPFEQLIDELPSVFDPWRTHDDVLPYLAGWLGLDLPPWSAYARRSLLASTGQIYRDHGTRAGLERLLAIYGGAHGAPRVAIDEGVALHVVDVSGAPRTLAPLSFSRTVDMGAAVEAVLLRPVAVALGPEDRIVVVDEGSDDSGPAIWVVGPRGNVPYAVTASRPSPRPLHRGPPLVAPSAVLTVMADVYVADAGEVTAERSTAAALYRIDAQGALSEVVSQQSRPGWAVRPVGLAQLSDGTFVVLDRGAHPLGDPPSQELSPAVTRLVEVRADGSVVGHDLPAVVEPTALALVDGDRLVVADAGDQASTLPAQLLLVDPKAGWSASVLLPAGEGNPLVFPVAVVLESPGVILVADTGVRWGYLDDAWNRSVAEAAAVYRIELDATPARCTRACDGAGLVMPTGLALAPSGRLVIADRGEQRKGVPTRDWRARHHEYGVSVLFSQQRPTEPQLRDRVRRELAELLASVAPAETTGWVDY